MNGRNPSRQRLAGVAMEGSDLASLLQKEFKPKSDEAKSAVEQAVQTLAQQALAQTQLIGSDVVKSIEAMIAAIDKKLTEQINQIMHHEDFQKLEGAWRGLHYMVNNTETDEQLKIRVMNISKNELGKTLKRYKGTDLGPEPDLQEGLLGRVRPVRRRAVRLPGRRLPLRPERARRRTARRDGQDRRRGASPRSSPALRPTLMQMDSWQELANPRDLTKIFTHAGVRRLALAARVGGRQVHRPGDAALPGAPAVRRARPTRSRSSTSRKTPGRPTTASTPGPTPPTRWRPTSTARSRSTAGARASAASSPAARCENLPTHSFPTDDGGVDMKCPTEIAIEDRREAELAKNGFMPLVHRKNSDFAAFIGAQSLQKPAEYDDPDATANANLAARLPYLFATCRFAHYLKCIVRDKIGSFKERDDMARWLAKLDHAVRRRRPGAFVGGDQGDAAAGRRRGGGRRRSRQPRLLLVQVLPAAALPARRA